MYLPDSLSGKPYRIQDHQRGLQLWLLAAIFVLAVVAFGRLRGITALIGLAVTFTVLLLFIVPAILDGRSPLLVAIVGSAAIMLTVLYLTHGVSIPISMAVVGTLASLILTGMFSALDHRHPAHRPGQRGNHLPQSRLRQRQHAGTPARRHPHRLPRRARRRHRHPISHRHRTRPRQPHLHRQAALPSRHPGRPLPHRLRRQHHHPRLRRRLAAATGPPRRRRPAPRTDPDQPGHRRGNRPRRRGHRRTHRRCTHHHRTRRLRRPPNPHPRCRRSIPATGSGRHGEPAAARLAREDTNLW